jgi:glycolate oxidase FAD binding subunit
VELLTPGSREQLIEILRAATADGRRLLPVGGRTHLDRGNPTRIDAEVSVRRLARLLSYDPAELVATVEAGMTCGELDAILAGYNQEWPVDAEAAATIGGVVAAGASSPRRLRIGPVRDWILGIEFVTGDGRLIRGGGRTIKNVSGYDLPRLLTGSLGTLGVIASLDLRLRPLPLARRTVRARGSVEQAATICAALPFASSVLATPGSIEVRLEGWPEDVEAQSRLVGTLLEDAHPEDDVPFPSQRPWLDQAVTVEAAVAPSSLIELTHAVLAPWGALAGVGLVWAGLPSAGEPLDELRALVAALGGIAPVTKGSGGLGPGGPKPGSEAWAIQRRIKVAFDPRGVLAPGRFWGEA